jgi:hypothetical protein
VRIRMRNPAPCAVLQGTALPAVYSNIIAGGFISGGARIHRSAVDVLSDGGEPAMGIN